MNNTKNQKNKADCCSIEAVVTIDDRGQILLPRDLREKADLKAGDKLAVVAAVESGQVCCLQMIKADKLATLVRDYLGPMLANFR